MADRQKLEAEHGVEYIQELGHFYTAVASVFHKLQCDSRIERYGAEKGAKHWLCLVLAVVAPAITHPIPHRGKSVTRHSQQ